MLKKFNIKVNIISYSFPLKSHINKLYLIVISGTKWNILNQWHKVGILFVYSEQSATISVQNNEVDRHTETCYQWGISGKLITKI